MEKISTKDLPDYQFAKAWDAPRGNMNVMRLIVALGLWMSMATQGGSAFWVWNRSTPLSASERVELQAGRVTTLYWHFAEIENRDGEWKWKKLPELPWFTRLTIYGADGKSRGHLRQWSWDDVVFRRELKLVSPTRNGITVFRAEKSFALGQAAVREGETLVARWPDIAALARAVERTAREVIYFRLPDARASSGKSLREFARRGKAAVPALTLTRVGDPLVLTNDGACDLPARAVGDGPQDRGYAVEVDAAGAVFRDAEGGEFFRVAGHREPDSENPKRVEVPSATRLTFWFSALPAGAALKSGVFQLAPAANSAPMKYRILNVVEDPPWKDFEPVR